MEMVMWQSLKISHFPLGIHYNIARKCQCYGSRNFSYNNEVPKFSKIIVGMHLTPHIYLPFRFFWPLIGALELTFLHVCYWASFPSNFPPNYLIHIFISYLFLYYPQEHMWYIHCHEKIILYIEFLNFEM